MSAIFQPPSEKLTQLKLFLQKTKTEFLSENSDLTAWLNDRKLTVDQLSFSQEDLRQQHSAAESVDKELLEKIATTNTTDAPLASHISQEEFRSIFEKMVELLQLPAGKLEEQSELYLEQQLSDILGFEVNANLDGHALLFSTGIMEALPHLKRSPTDSLQNHTNYQEAGIGANRSAFGWFSGSSEMDQIAINQEKFYIAVPLYYHQEWSQQQVELKKWYKFRKVVVINPVEKVAVVAVIGDIGPDTYTRRQFGGSPELIHAGKIWSPKSAGKVLVLFVDDPENTVALGPIQL